MTEILVYRRTIDDTPFRKCKTCKLQTVNTKGLVCNRNGEQISLEGTCNFFQAKEVLTCPNQILQ